MEIFYCFYVYSMLWAHSSFAHNSSAFIAFTHFDDEIPTKKRTNDSVDNVNDENDQQQQQQQNKKLSLTYTNAHTVDKEMKYEKL